MSGFVRERALNKDIGWIWSRPASSDLALEATQARHRSRGGQQRRNRHAIIFATLSPDHDFPGTGCFLQAKLDVPGIPAIDIRQQCTGFIYGMSIADQFIRTGMYQRVLLVGAEVHSKGLDKTTRGRDVSVLFGDGAGAVVMGSVSALDASEKKARMHSIRRIFTPTARLRRSFGFRSSWLRA